MPIYIPDIIDDGVIESCFKSFEEKLRLELGELYERIIDPAESKFYETHLEGKDLTDYKKYSTKANFDMLLDDAFSQTKRELYLNCDGEERNFYFHWLKNQINHLNLINPLKTFENFEIQLMRVFRREILINLRKELKLEIEPKLKITDDPPIRER